MECLKRTMAGWHRFSRIGLYVEANACMRIYMNVHIYMRMHVLILKYRTGRENVYVYIYICVYVSI